jgi:hypothetical protein
MALTAFRFQMSKLINVKDVLRSLHVFLHPRLLQSPAPWWESLPRSSKAIGEPLISQYGVFLTNLASGR